MTSAPTNSHGHSHDGHGHGHGSHGHRSGSWLAKLRHVVTPHSHDTADVVDGALEASRRGMRALWISFAALMVTAAAQAVLVSVTSSVALLGDTLHNFADALTAVPLAIAFLLGRRAATRRFTYGLGRTEDLAGLVVVLVIAGSAGLAAWEAVDRLTHPRQVTNLGWLVLAGLVGFAGNELVARYRIKVGKQIGSAALVADGLHARTDGFTSFAVLLSAGGIAAGWSWADPVVGLLITLAIVSVLWGAAREVFGRLLDGVDPHLVHLTEQVAAETPGVAAVQTVRLRWVGHALHAEIDIAVDSRLSIVDAHNIAHDAEHRLLHAVPRLVRSNIHTNPLGPQGQLAHSRTAHHNHE
ncbi:cation diffusion facilitator family transporter [Actinopolymorpha singaporensis]|uniref:Cation diffusion facilitator family transporter n=2 Tax=Actinopolymorpha singaporensis TaxID=117157 RepID=A0A1H1YBW4_9ACTN|nr:cation diffusion facilitator family transporter [Actinopolymorpha singaporensis]